MMSSSSQTVVALLVVALAAAGLVWRAVANRGRSHCGDACGAVSPDARAFLKRLKKG